MLSICTTHVHAIRMYMYIYSYIIYTCLYDACSVHTGLYMHYKCTYMYMYDEPAWLIITQLPLHVYENEFWICQNPSLCINEMAHSFDIDRLRMSNPC